jgi:hypothetical protein
MTRGVVLFPWRPGDPDRERSFSIVRRHYGLVGLPVFIGDSGADRFSPGASRNVAARDAGDWDVAVIVDADCVMPMWNINRGIVHAVGTGRVTLPWDSFFSMTEEGHGKGYDKNIPIGHCLAEREWQSHSIGCERPLYSPGGNVIVPRDVWDRVGGYDERFEGWGFEDAAFLIAAGEFDRLSGPLYHFWHRSRAFETPIPAFYNSEYRGKPVDQFLVDEGRHINRFGSWG